MIIRVGLRCLLALGFLLSQSPVVAAVSDLSMTDRQLVSKQRVSRSDIDYTYTLTVHNAGVPLTGVVVTVSSLSNRTVIQQAEVALGILDSGSTQSTETFVLRQDRRVPFDPADLVFTFTADEPLAAAMPALSFEPVKVFRFTWTDVDKATHYKLLENPDGKSGFVQVGEDIPQGSESVGHVVPLYARVNAQYILQSCNAAGCRDSAAVAVSGTLVGSIGYFKASNTGERDHFGWAVSLSADGNTLAVAAWGEGSNATGINGDQSDNSVRPSGAVYIFTRSEGTWFQQAYVKASNTGKSDVFGSSVSLSGDGDTLAVAAGGEGSNATGINGDQSDNSMDASGAVYVFTRSGGAWSQQAYVKASNTGDFHWFGSSVSLSGDGDTLAVGAPWEDSNATGINGDQSDNSAGFAGAVYVFTLSGGTWSQQAYVKASNTDGEDYFGSSVSLSGDGDTLAVGASWEDSNATGINGAQGNNLTQDSGAVYVFTRSEGSWFQQAYIKASNTGERDHFGGNISLSADGNTLVVGALVEDSNATGINGGQGNNLTQDSGAVYVFTRSGGTWFQQAYVKASNTGQNHWFGSSVSLSRDGDTLAVGARREDSNATGINGDQSDNSARRGAGAVYVFTRSRGIWFQQTYIKASNAEESDWFGSVSLSADGDTLAVGARWEASNATGINGDQSDNSVPKSGAVYLY